SLVAGAHVTDSLTVSSADGTASHTINASIAIDATVTDDRAVTEAGGLANAIAGDPSASGKLLVSDVDSGENHFATVSAAAKAAGHGDFTFNEATGAWT